LDLTFLGEVKKIERKLKMFAKDKEVVALKTQAIKIQNIPKLQFVSFLT
jgi:hypothetical protein